MLLRKSNKEGKSTEKCKGKAQRKFSQVLVGNKNADKSNYLKAGTKLLCLGKRHVFFLNEGSCVVKQKKNYCSKEKVLQKM